MGAGAGREGKRRVLLRRESTAGSVRRSAQAIVQDAAARLDVLADPAVAAGGESAPAEPATAGTRASAGNRDAGDLALLLRDLWHDLDETDALLDALAREVRVALTVIKGRAQLLRRQAFATGAPDHRLVRSAEEIDRAVIRIDRLLHDRLLAPPEIDGAGERRADDS